MGGRQLPSEGAAVQVSQCQLLRGCMRLPFQALSFALKRFKLRVNTMTNAMT